MPPIVQGLPYVYWVVLVALAVGALGFAAASHVLATPTRGYLRFTGFSAAILAALAFAADGALPPTGELAIRPSGPELDALRRLGLVGLAALSLAYALLMGRRRLAIAVGAAGLAAGGLAIAAAAFGWAPTTVHAVPFVVQLTVLSAATGGSLAAIALGHWYLVTPKLSERPLVFQARLLLAVVALQVLLFIVWTTLGGGPGQAAFAALGGGSALLVWLRLLVTLVFPLVLTWMAARTAQTRSMESATGLLYINLAAVMAGTIGAAALYVSGGLLV